MDYIKWIRSKVGHKTIFLNFAGGYIEDKNGRILLQKRKDRNVWGFPGGAIEIGESAEEAAIREVKEETGRIVEAESLISVYTKYFDEYPNGDKAQTITFFFKLKVVGGELSTSDEETLDLQYFDIENPPSLVNQQHGDAWEDYMKFNQHKQVVIR